jgi:hypothetical protein
MTPMRNSDEKTRRRCALRIFAPHRLPPGGLTPAYFPLV